MRILIADDDRDLVDLLTYWLKGQGYEVVRAYDGDQAIARWRETDPGLVILDIEMPGPNGFEICRRMSGESNALVLILTGHDREADEVRALDLGADDYLRKPFSPRQLLARIRALARRATNLPQSVGTSPATNGSIRLDPMRHEVTQNGVTTRLTPIESRLLYLLMANSGQVLPTDLIVERVWGYSDCADNGLVKTHIHHLRQKLEREPGAPRYILTIPGVGYSFAAQPSEPSPQPSPELSHDAVAHL